VVSALPKEGERFHTGHRSLYVQLLNIHHGRTRPVENLGFIVELAGKRVLHIGDSEAEPAVFQKYEVVRDRIDVAFLPFWYFLNDDFKRAVREQIGPRHIVVMHIELDSALSRLRGNNWEKKWAQIKAEFPNAVFFAKEMEKKSFD
jgi:L-ascorbate metabolism protein UlaG (beta-lactamase superfamily)